MRLGDISLIRVQDLTFGINMPWGRLRKLSREFKDVSEQTVDKTFDAITNVLRDTIISCEGLLDAEDKPIIWEPELVEELPSTVVSELFGQLMDVVESKRPGDPLPAGSTPPGP